MKAFTILLVFILSICCGPSLGMEPEKSENDESEIYLPTIAIFTGYLKDFNAINIILLSSNASEKAKFVKILNNNESSLLPLKRSIYTDFISFAQSEDVKFNIYDQINTRSFSRVLDSYFSIASVILIFDEQEEFLNQCKTNKALEHSKCHVLSLFYSSDSCKVIWKDKLINYRAVNGKNGPFNAQSARAIVLNLFTQLAEEIKKATQQKNPDNKKDCTLF